MEFPQVAQLLTTSAYISEIAMTEAERCAAGNGCGLSCRVITGPGMPEGLIAAAYVSNSWRGGKGWAHGSVYGNVVVAAGRD